MMKPVLLAAALLFSTHAIGAICPEPGKVTLPLEHALQTSAIILEYDMNNPDGPDFTTPMADRVMSQLEGASEPRRDAMLLALLHWQTLGTLPLFNVTMHDAAPLFDSYLDLLDRNDLPEAAAALRQSRKAFILWNTTPAARYAQWSDGRGTVNPIVDIPLRAASERFERARPAIIARSEERAAEDPAFLAELDARLKSTPEFERFNHLAYLVEACVQEDPAQTLADLPAILRHTALVHRFVLEAGNGSSHQYFFNSTGTDAPDFLETLVALDLDQQATDFAAAMALLGTPYSTDTQIRRDRILNLSEAQDEALAEPTWIMDDDELYTAIFDAVKAAGYWPQ